MDEEAKAEAKAVSEIGISDKFDVDADAVNTNDASGSERGGWQYSSEYF